MVECPCQDGLLPGLSYSLSWGLTHVFRFDIISFQFTGLEDEDGILSSRDAVNSLIDQEINGGIPASKIVVGGFSQGGALTLVTGLMTPHKLAGLTVMSGWFAIRGKVKAVCRGKFVLATEVFEPPLVAPRTTCNHCTHLLGTRQGGSTGPAVNREVIKGRARENRREGS